MFRACRAGSISKRLRDGLSRTSIDLPDTDPLAARGIGEIGITGTGAAIANAIYHATGERVCDLPITPDRLVG